MKDYSKYALCVCIFVIILGLLYKPRWKGEYVHATISYDVSGYYIYLPAIFIYKDLQKVSFKEPIHKKYKNSSHTYQTFTYTNGNEVCKYPCGMAIQYLPFFILADVLAEPLGYERDGYSIPYQAGIHWGSAIIAFLGLFYLRKSLLEYFSNKITGLVLILLLIGTNYLNYVTVDAAMTHNYLFTLSSLLIWNSIQFHKNPSYFRAICIGLIIGLAALTRPTEILLFLIPMFWGANFSLGKDSFSIKNRYYFLLKEFPKVAVSILVCGILGSIQLVYWKYVGDDWVINSYNEDMGFDWFSPHINEGLFSYRKGWLIYTPIMGFSLLGIGLMIFKKKPLGLFLGGYISIVIYITFSWSVWWYSGSLGQRPMVQNYALLIFSFSFFIKWIAKYKKALIPFLCLALFSSYYNICLHHQAHKGGMLDPSSMTKKYFWKIFLKWEKDVDDYKFLDIDEEFKGERKDIKRLYFNDFEKDTITKDCGIDYIHGKGSYCIPLVPGLSGEFKVPLVNTTGTWIRVGGL